MLILQRLTLALPDLQLCLKMFELLVDQGEELANLELKRKCGMSTAKWPLDSSLEEAVVQPIFFTRDIFYTSA
jgi:hypothetical protein